MSEVLFLCTGNLCRSPSAALFTDLWLTRSGRSGDSVHSAGTLGSVGGSPDLLVKEALDFGLDLSSHIGRQIDRDMIATADLVIGMSREHLREVVLADPPSFSKTFTLREIVRLGREKGTRRPDESLEVWLVRLHHGRRHAGLLGQSADDDIADPMGGTTEDYRRMLEDLSALTRSLRRLAWPTPQEELK